MAVLVGLPAPSGSAKDNASNQEYLQDTTQNPPGVRFTIRLADGKTQFYPGEVIAVELSFTSSIPETYLWSNRSYDRSGRLGIDEFRLEPSDGAADPMADYFGSQSAHTAGGLFSSSLLGAEPRTITVEINEWLRINRPGHYRLHVVSHRVSRERLPEEPGTGEVTLPTVSNVVEFQVLAPNTNWANQELARALQVLDGWAPSQTFSATESSRRRACRVLRFLGTEAAAVEMARRVGIADIECGFEYVAGLFGSPHRARIVRELEARFENPTEPVSSSLLWVLTQLAYLKGSGPWPRYPAGDPERVKEWQQTYQQRSKARQDLYWSFMEKLARLLPQKLGSARTLSLATVVEAIASTQHTRKAQEMSPGLDSLWQEVAISFLDLPAQTQSTFLNVYWNHLRRPEIGPALTALYESPPRGIHGFQELVLVRLHEIDPHEGRRLILADIRNASPHLSGRVLGMLPEKTLPELDEVFAENLEKYIDDLDRATRSAELVARYATNSIFERVRAAYGDHGGRWACSIQAPLLAYFLRVNPEFGEEQVRQALAARSESHSRCYTRLLGDVARFHVSPRLIELAARHLEDESPEVAADAATVLGKYGPPGAQELLWKRFGKWHEQWQGREQELSPSFKRSSANSEQAGLESALWQGLSHASAWILGPEQMQRLGELCVTQNCSTQAEQLLQSSAQKVPIGYSDFLGRRSWRVGHFELDSLDAVKAKLEQFPARSVFFWQLGDPTDAERQKLFQEIESFVAARGMILEPSPTAK